MWSCVLHLIWQCLEATDTPCWGGQGKVWDRGPQPTSPFLALERYFSPSQKWRAAQEEQEPRRWIWSELGIM